ncbi:DotA/TraY family protein [Burkholderia pseudomallei]|uniref:DotA/TraY family protein n=1 Tax=Burkholderia pseudomallei TaxID=28450 RepID=UPI0040632165
MNASQGKDALRSQRALESPQPPSVLSTEMWSRIQERAAREGDGLGHKTAHGYIFLLEMMVRPILMVIGFFLGGAGIVAGGTLLNEGFGVALANAQFDSLTGIGSILAFCTIYFSMCLNLVHSCFNLIFLVPDKVINWVGGVAPAMIGSHHSERTKTALNTMLAKFDIRPSSGGGRRPLGGTSPSSKSDGIRE